MVTGKLRILNADILDVKGNLIKKGTAVIVDLTKKSSSHNVFDTCIAYADNGGHYVEEWIQHTVVRKKILDNSF